MAAEKFGPYRLEALIGRGGMGEVYRSFDTDKGRYVALKRLPPHPAADAEFQARFRRESQRAARLRDPHVIPIHDFGEIDGWLFIDMRLVEGTNLATLLSEQGGLPPARAVRIVAQVASALDAAHADGLVHRDVKPSNVLLDGTTHEPDFVYLIDFGIAHATTATSLTATGTTVGTADYMAPERFLHGPGDHRVDVYSLACLLYEALSGHRPFPGEGWPAQMHAHLNLSPPRPSATRPSIPAGLDDVVAYGMAKEPDHRYSSAGALADAAQAVLSGIPLNTYPTMIAQTDEVVVIRRATSAPAIPQHSIPEDSENTSGRHHKHEPPQHHHHHSGPLLPPYAYGIGQLPGRPASFGIRLASFLMDYFAPLLIIPIVLVGCIRILESIGMITLGDKAGPFALATAYLGLIAFMIWNSGYRQGTTGQSFGRQVTKTKLVKIRTGKPIGFGMALFRLICHFVDYITVFIGFLRPLWDPKRQTFADKIVGTVVVRIDNATKDQD